MVWMGLPSNRISGIPVSTYRSVLWQYDRQGWQVLRSTERTGDDRQVHCLFDLLFVSSAYFFELLCWYGSISRLDAIVSDTTSGCIPGNGRCDDWASVQLSLFPRTVVHDRMPIRAVAICHAGSKNLYCGLRFETW